MTIEELNQLRGADVVSETGETIGELEEIYTDVETDLPEWISIPTGFATTRRLLAPAARVERRKDALVVPYSAEQVRRAPDVESDELDEETERRLYDHYGLDYSEREARKRGPARVWFRSLEQPDLDL
jgi:uncharacterized protein YrrD